MYNFTTVQNKVPKNLQKNLPYSSIFSLEKKYDKFFGVVALIFYLCLHYLSLQSRFAVATSVYTFCIELLTRLEVPRCANANSE